MLKSSALLILHSLIGSRVLCTGFISYAYGYFLILVFGLRAFLISVRRWHLLFTNVFIFSIRNHAWTWRTTLLMAINSQPKWKWKSTILLFTVHSSITKMNLVFLGVSFNMMTRWKAFPHVIEKLVFNWKATISVNFSLSRPFIKIVAHSAILHFNWIGYWTLNHMQLNILLLLYDSTCVSSLFLLHFRLDQFDPPNWVNIGLQFNFGCASIPQWPFIIRSSLYIYFL